MNKIIKNKFLLIFFSIVLIFCIPLTAYASTIKVVYGDFDATSTYYTISVPFTLNDTCSKIFYACEGDNESSNISYNILSQSNGYSVASFSGGSNATSQNVSVYLPYGNYTLLITSSKTGSYHYALNFTNE